MRFPLALIPSLALASACAQVPAASTPGTPAVPASGATASPSASAAPRTGTDVFRLMHDRYAGKWYGSVAFTQMTEIALPNDSIVRQTWYETGRMPGLLRIDRAAKDGKNVVIFRGDSTYVRRNGGAFVGRKSRNTLMTLGFDVYAQAPERSAEIMTSEGYDMSKVSEATWEGRPVWVVGALAGDSATRQFWVDQERLVYVRSLEPGLRDSTKQAEIIFGGYEPLAGGWIAKTVTVREGGKLLQREQYSDVVANVPAPDEMFDPARIP